MVSLPSPVPTRRERLRAQALAEIREHAYVQIAAGGAAALSLNGIAKAMGMSGAAMYRYFASREELLTTLIAESYEDLAASLHSAHTAALRRTPEGRVRAVAEGYRDWALTQPSRYRLVFQSALSGVGDPERIIAASQQAMDVILLALGDLTRHPRPVTPPGLARDLSRWGARTGAPQADPDLYLGAQTMWSRLHGIISLEIEGVYGQMQVDAATLYAQEVNRIVTDLTNAAGEAAHG